MLLPLQLNNLLSAGQSLTVDAGSYSFTGNDLNIRRGFPLICSPGTYNLTGGQMFCKVKIPLSSGSYYFTGSEIDINFYGLNRVYCNPGQYRFIEKTVKLLTPSQIGVIRVYENFKHE